jgi:DNA-binding IclR family transcriptional regulator
LESNGRSFTHSCAPGTPRARSFCKGKDNSSIAFSPRRLIAAQLKSEMSQARKRSLRYRDLSALNQKTLDQLIERVRSAGCATTEGTFVPGLNGLAAPILNWQGEIEASITLAATDPRILDPKGNAKRLLLEACRNVALQTTLLKARE